MPRIHLALVIAAAVTGATGASPFPMGQGRPGGPPPTTPAGAAQDKPVDAALVERFARAGDDERAALYASRPEVATDAFRLAVSQLGSEQTRRGDLPGGERTYRGMLWLADREQNEGARAAALIDVATAVGQQGDLAQAQTLLTEALAIAERINDQLSVQSAVNDLGIVLRRFGDNAAALTMFERALAIADELHQKDLASRVLNNIGISHMYLGNGVQAREYFDRSLALKDDDGGHGTQDMARTIGNVGALYAEQGDYAQALDNYQKALALFERSGGGPGLTSMLNNIGNAYAGMHRDDLARPYYERALPIAEASGDRQKVATLLYNLGNISRNAGRWDEAEDFQRRCLTMREEFNEPAALMESLTDLAGLLTVRHHPADALPYAERAVALGIKTRLLPQLWKAQTAEAQTLAILGRSDDAIAQYTASIATIEALRRMTVGGDRARQLYFAERLGPYYGLAGMHAAAGRSFEAFATVERARARALIDIIEGGRQATRFQSDDERARERQLTVVVLSLSSEIAMEAGRPKPDPAKLASLDDKLGSAQRARDDYVARLYEAQPGLRLARGDAPAVSREALAALVPTGTAIASFVIDEHAAWGYYVTAGPNGPTVAARRLAMDPDALMALANRFATQVASRDLAFAAAARSLYDALFSGVDLTAVRHLIVVPDGALWRVPFQALETPAGRFMIEERAVSYVPSVSALAALQARERSRPAREPFLLALGDPAIGGEIASTHRGADLQRLPEAAREVRALGQLYGAAHSRVLVDAQATETALREQLPRATVVHVATHGMLDDRNPMYSRLLLTPGRGDDSGSDGRLEAWEVMSLPVNADIAVLSACETVGGVGEGEGEIGLSWALFAAGASTAVVSQWEVDSSSTTALMIAFHQRLLGVPASSAGGKMSAPDALRAASITLMKNPAQRHPFYWAGFIVMGAS